MKNKINKLMKQILRVLCFGIFLFSCSKEDVNPLASEQPDYARLLQANLWALDSVYVNGNRENMQGTLKIKYGNNGIYTVYTSYDDDLTKEYEVSGNKIYWWSHGNQKISSQFYVIEQIDSTSLTESETDTEGKELKYYYHGG